MSVVIEDSDEDDFYNDDGYDYFGGSETSTAVAKDIPQVF